MFLKSVAHLVSLSKYLEEQGIKSYLDIRTDKYTNSAELYTEDKILYFFVIPDSDSGLLPELRINETYRKYTRIQAEEFSEVLSKAEPIIEKYKIITNLMF